MPDILTQEHTLQHTELWVLKLNHVNSNAGDLYMLFPMPGTPSPTSSILTATVLETTATSTFSENIPSVPVLA